MSSLPRLLPPHQPLTAYCRDELQHRQVPRRIFGDTAVRRHLELGMFSECTATKP